MYHFGGETGKPAPVSPPEEGRTETSRYARQQIDRPPVVLEFVFHGRLRYCFVVTAAKIIEEIKKLPPEQQAEVIRFAYHLDAERRLSGKDLSALAERMTRATDPAEAALVREAIVRGFYGGEQIA